MNELEVRVRRLERALSLLVGEWGKGRMTEDVMAEARAIMAGKRDEP